MRSALLLLIFFCCDVSIAQTLPYAKDVVQTLTSEEFQGRGYVNQGDSIAAEFIAGEFQGFGLLSYGDSYFQNFKVSVNTFPGDIRLSINDNELSEGVDYLVNPGSPSISGSFEVIEFSLSDMLDQYKIDSVMQIAPGNFILVDYSNLEEFDEVQQGWIQQIENFLKFHPDNPAEGSIFISNEKLTWSGSQVQHPKPSFTIQKESLPEESFDSFYVDLKAELKKNYQTKNVIGYFEGVKSDSVIVLTAHYDHFGKMGTALFPGANDNASGTAMLLSLAKYYSEIPPDNTTVFIAFGSEEIGLLGSKYFVRNPLLDLTDVKFLLNFDLAGTGDEGIQVVNGSVFRDKFDLLQSINQSDSLLPQVKIRGAACNSDHCPFVEAGVPGFYIYTLGGIRAYHDVNDRFETLPFTEFEDYFKLIIRFLEEL